MRTACRRGLRQSRVRRTPSCGARPSPGEKQQNTTRVMPRGAAASSDATVPTAMRAARSAGKAVDAGRDRRERDRARGDARPRARARCDSRRRAGHPRPLPPPPHTGPTAWMTCLRLEPIAARDLGAAGLAAAERFAFLEQLGPGRAMDRAIDAAAAKQRAVRRVDDGVDRKRRDVGDDDVEARGADFGGEEGRGHAPIYPPPQRGGGPRLRGGWGDFAVAPAPYPARFAATSPRNAGEEQASRPLRLRLGAQVDRAAHADVVEMLVEEAPRRRAPPACSISKKSKSV